MHIVIIGYSGSGKSTLANRISSQANIPVLHIDSVRWRAGWKQRSDDEMNFILANFMSDHHDWVIEGTYHRFKFEERLQLADMILILALPRIQCFVRAYKRYLKYRGSVRPDMAPGCTEQFDAPFVWWLLIQERTQKRRDLFRRIVKEYNSKTVILKTQKQIDDFEKMFESTLLASREEKRA